MFESAVTFIRQTYRSDGFIPLHAPVFAGNEKAYLNECVDSTFVSSVGQFVDRFETEVARFTGSRHAVAVVNGTLALFTALKLADAAPDTEVITQSLTFAATANAIRYTGAAPVFIDVDRDTLGMSPQSLEAFLGGRTLTKNGRTYSKSTGRRIVACVPMHTFGHPCRIDEIKTICQASGIQLIEDAAESLGSRYKGRHTGTFGKMGIFSFNGNKVITTGGGGMLVTDDAELARRAKHLTTTAKQPHPWEFIHDEVGFNFRMPNINAALGVAQMEKLPELLEKKRRLAERYQDFFTATDLRFVGAPPQAESNFWLNTLQLADKTARDAFLEQTNGQNIMTRPLWRPMHLLDIYKHCQKDSQKNAEFLYERIVNIPSSVRP